MCSRPGSRRRCACSSPWCLSLIHILALYGAKYPNKNLRGIITSGALTQDNAGLVSGVPKGLEPHQKLPNELGAGVCSVPEVVDWYGKDPYNTQTFTTGLCYAICDGVAWFKTAVKDFTYPVLMLHGEKDGLDVYKRQDMN